MLNYYRKITYIYECANGITDRGCGFIKTEIKDGKGLVTIEFSGANSREKLSAGYYTINDVGAKVCFFMEKIPECRNVKMCHEFNPQDMEGVELKDIAGIVIKINDTYYAAQWNDEIFNENKAEIVDSLKAPIVVPEKKELESQEIPDFLKTRKKISDKDVSQDRKNYVRINDWKELFRKYDEVFPFEDDNIQSLVELSFDDLKYLPKTCLNAQNNSFLLHGLFVHSHILIGKVKCRKKEKVYALLVPGIYDSGERVMAAMFGFDNFKKGKRDGEDNRQFGYWYSFFRDEE